VFQLILISSVMTMFIGVLQVLSEPLVLSFSDSKTLGAAETVCAMGMLVTALITGITGIRKKHARILGTALAMAGLFMILFALRENIALICLSGFLFFAMLPLANSSLDYLARTNIPDELQGRAWGFIGFLSQLGYIPAYALAGILADRAAGTLKISVGRGSALIIAVSGALLIAVSVLSLFSRRIRNLETGEELTIPADTQGHLQADR
jgi:MFS family permease